jgi:uncharacterized protein YukE
MSIIGGDYEQLTILKATFDREAGIVQDLTSTLRSRLADTYWRGAQAEQFRSTWSSEYEPSLKKLEQALLDAGAQVAAARDRLLDAGA